MDCKWGNQSDIDSLPYKNNVICLSNKLLVVQQITNNMDISLSFL